MVSELISIVRGGVFVSRFVGGTNFKDLSLISTCRFFFSGTSASSLSVIMVLDAAHKILKYENSVNISYPNRILILTCLAFCFV